MNCPYILFHQMSNVEMRQEKERRKLFSDPLFSPYSLFPIPYSLFPIT